MKMVKRRKQVRHFQHKLSERTKTILRIPRIKKKIKKIYSKNSMKSKETIKLIIFEKKIFVPVSVELIS
jgi:hypothetical protein